MTEFEALIRLGLAIQRLAIEVQDDGRSELTLKAAQSLLARSRHLLSEHIKKYYGQENDNHNSN